MTLRKERILSFEGGSSRSHYVESSLWKRLWTCRKTLLNELLRGRLEKWSRVLESLWSLGHCHLIGHSPGWLVVFNWKCHRERISVHSGADRNPKSALFWGIMQRRCHLYCRGSLKSRVIENPSWRTRGAVEETAAHVLCKCETLNRLAHHYLASFYPVDVSNMNLRAVRKFIKGTGLFWLRIWLEGNKRALKMV
jgi:hypothetical protein